jgi:hypothetical protein
MEKREMSTCLISSVSTKVEEERAIREVRERGINTLLSSTVS